MTGASPRHHRRHHRLRGHAGSAYVALSSWRGQDQAAEQPRTESGSHPSFSVIEGGRSKKSRGSRGRSPQQQHSMMERFEERWRRRRDQNGY